MKRNIHITLHFYCYWWVTVIVFVYWYWLTDMLWCAFCYLFIHSTIYYIVHFSSLSQIELNRNCDLRHFFNCRKFDLKIVRNRPYKGLIFKIFARLRHIFINCGIFCYDSNLLEKLRVAICGTFFALRFAKKNFICELRIFLRFATCDKNFVAIQLWSQTAFVWIRYNIEYYVMHSLFIGPTNR